MKNVKFLFLFAIGILSINSCTESETQEPKDYTVESFEATRDSIREYHSRIGDTVVDLHENYVNLLRDTVDSNSIKLLLTTTDRTNCSELDTVLTLKASERVVLSFIDQYDFLVVELDKQVKNGVIIQSDTVTNNYGPDITIMQKGRGNSIDYYLIGETNQLSETFDPEKQRCYLAMMNQTEYKDSVRLGLAFVQDDSTLYLNTYAYLNGTLSSIDSVKDMNDRTFFGKTEYKGDFDGWLIHSDYCGNNFPRHPKL